MTALLKFEKVGDSYQVFAWNGVSAGHIEMAADGYMVFWPNTQGGFWEAPYLHEIANKLDELNREWDWIVNNDPTIPGLPCENCGHTSFNYDKEDHSFDCAHCGSRWETTEPYPERFECFECGSPIVDGVCEYCEKEWLGANKTE